MQYLKITRNTLELALDKAYEQGEFEQPREIYEEWKQSIIDGLRTGSIQ